MDWRKTISNLLKKAEDPATPKPEAEALTDKATELMIKYGIDEKLIRNQDHSKSGPGTVGPQHVEYQTFTIINPYKTHKARLLHGLAEAFGCSAVRDSTRVFVFGDHEDIERLKVLYASLLIQMLLGLAAVQVPNFEHGKSYKHAWLLAFIGNVVRRVKAIAEHAKNEIPGTALVLRSTDQAVQKLQNQLFPKTRKSGGSRYDPYSSGLADGAHAGNLADVGQARMGGSVRSLPRAKESS